MGCTTSAPIDEEAYVRKQTANRKHSSGKQQGSDRYGASVASKWSSSLSCKLNSSCSFNFLVYAVPAVVSVCVIGEERFPDTFPVLFWYVYYLVPLKLQG